MSIIPISPDKALVHKCADGSEIYFRYLTGKHRAEYQDIQEVLYDKSKPYIEEAKKLAAKQISELKKSTKAQEKKDVPIPSIERLTAQNAISLAKQNGAITSADEDRQTAAYVDLFVTGWKGKGFEPKKPDVPPSHYFTPTSIAELMEILSEHIQELMGLTVQDQKN